jgi:S-adenosylmethionine:tRNA ribosyltransferase-isomerase
VNLDIGLDTFRPVQTRLVEQHHMHTEKCALSPEGAQQVNQAKLERRRIIAVGTTSVRVLETAARVGGRAPDGPACPWQTVRTFHDATDLFIYPGFEFRVVDALITNFHLPRSSLLMLVSAFAGRELILEAYEEAVREGYRFYSFGDAMLIL